MGCKFIAAYNNSTINETKKMYIKADTGNLISRLLIIRGILSLYSK